jgi:hypothetical protein
MTPTLAPARYDSAMSKRTMVQGAVGAVCALALVACGGGKQANAPGTCPDGTILKGEDCLPIEAAAAGDTTGGPATDKTDTKETEKVAASASAQGPSDDAAHASSSTSGPSSAASSTSDSTPTSTPGGKTPYDKDAVEVQLKRAARQIKANCGSATDDEGKATGPWGATKATVVLGRNGHVKQILVPSPYDGRPVGVCVVHAFEKIWFPPYPGPSDASVDWTIEIVQPKHR